MEKESKQNCEGAPVRLLLLVACVPHSISVRPVKCCVCWWKALFSYSTFFFKGDFRSDGTDLRLRISIGTPASLSSEGGLSVFHYI